MLYGLEDEKPDSAKQALGDVPPIKGTFGKTSIFSQDGKPYDVVYVAVDSPDLIAANKLLAELPNQNDYPNYTPHMTLAYVTKGKGSKYAGMDALAGQAFTADSVTYSSKDGTKTAIPLKSE